MRLILYSTLGCHLCEQVEEMLCHLQASFPHRLVKLDIADDDELLAAYATEIPVLLRVDIDMEMAWPFTIDQLAQFLSLPADA